MILTRYAANAPRRCRAGEELSALAAHGATLVIHLGAQAIEEIVATLAAALRRATARSAVVARASLARRADPPRHAGDDRRRQCTAAGVRRTATIIVGPALAAEGFRDSHLYSRARAGQRRSR